MNREDIINETILLITKGESTSISELQYVWENFTPQLDSDIEEDLNNLFKWDSDLKVSFIKIEYQELVSIIKQHISNQQEELKAYKRRAKNHKNSAIKFQSKLDKIENYIRTELCCGIVYDKIKQLLKEETK